MKLVKMPFKKPPVVKETYVRKVTTPSGSRTISNSRHVVHRNTKNGQFSMKPEKKK